MVTLHVLADGQGNLAASKMSEPVHGCTKTLGTTKIDETTWNKLCHDPELANRGQLNEFLRQLVPAQVEQIVAIH